MYKLLTKNGQVFAFGLGVLITVIFLGSVFSGIDSFNGLSEEGQYASGIFNFGLVASIALIVLGALAMVGFTLYQLVTDPKGAMKGIIGIAIVLAIFGITYATAKPETFEAIVNAEKEFNVSPGASKFITGSITSALALMAIAAIAFVGSEIRNFFK